MNRNGRNIGINMNGVGERIVMITPKQPPGQQRFASHAEHSKGISPAGSHGFVGHQPLPVVAGAILIQADFDRIQFIALQISCDGVFGFPTDGMVFNSTIEQDQFSRNAPDPSEAVDDGSRFAAFNLRVSDGGQFRRCFPDGGRTAGVGLCCAAA